MVFDDARGVWRVEYAGMVREHQQEWQARVWLQDAVNIYGLRLHNDGPPA